jgi:hypothetical protein
MRPQLLSARSHLQKLKYSPKNEWIMGARGSGVKLNPEFSVFRKPVAARTIGRWTPPNNSKSEFGGRPCGRGYLARQLHAF